MIERKAGTYRFTPRWALKLSQTNISDRYNRTFYRHWPQFPNYGTRKIGGKAVKHVIPLGTHCLTADLLKIVGLRKVAFPFDWLLAPPSVILECIEDDLSLLTNNEFVDFPTSNCAKGEHSYYKTRGAPDLFSHVTTQLALDNLNRRADRFRRVCSDPSKGPLLFFMISREGFDSTSTFTPIIRALSERVKKFEFLCVQLRKPSGGRETSLKLVRETRVHRLFEFTPISDESRLGYFPDPLDGLQILRLVEEYHFDGGKT